MSFPEDAGPGWKGEARALLDSGRVGARRTLLDRLCDGGRPANGKRARHVVARVGRQTVPFVALHAELAIT
jgi:hypothetical protein